jgi:hypothetical protein
MPRQIRAAGDAKPLIGKQSRHGFALIITYLDCGHSIRGKQAGQHGRDPPVIVETLGTCI